MTEEQRARLAARFGLPPPPSPYRPISTEVLRQAFERAERDARKIATISTAIAAALYVPVYLAAGSLAAVIAVTTIGPAITSAVTRWWLRRHP